MDLYEGDRVAPTQRAEPLSLRLDQPAVRLADIAVQAGVSEATVSRVINGKQNVSPATRQAVLTALDVLGFERPLRTRQRSAGLVGLITPELDNPIFPAFAQVIERTLTMRGYTPVLCTQIPGGATEDEFTGMLSERGVAGIVFVSGMHADTTAKPDRYQRLIERNLPIVLINGYVPGIAAPFFSVDDRAAMHLAVRHLTALGHERIGLAVGQVRYFPVVRKLEGFKDAIGVAGPNVEGRIEHSLFAFEGGQSAGAALINQGCTAIVCGSDMMALGAVRAVRDRGLRVPEDISVVGFDDSPLIAFTDPPLTTVRQPVAQMASAAARTLLDGIAGVPATTGEFMFQPELVVRGSTAVRDPHSAR
jgi:LacI family transcriptional regulator, repressor for deo operon, udp, cdd, tsx, nupC, and nupG